MKTKAFLAATTAGLLAAVAFAAPAQASGGVITNVNAATFLTGAIAKTVDLGITFDNTDYEAGYFTSDSSTIGCDELPSGLSFDGDFGVGSPAADATNPVLSIVGTPSRSVSAGNYDICLVVTKGSDSDSETMVLTIGGYNPTEFTPRGTSWVGVPFADRIYAKTEEHFLADNNEYDDDSIHYLPAGETCEINADDSFAGPALIVDGQPTCTNQAEDAVAGIPLGFTVNFGGQSFTEIYLTTNGMLSFDPGQDDYDDTLSQTAVGNDSSGISALGMDLGYYSFNNPAEHTNIWISNTATVDGKPAFVATWENAASHGDDALKADFQIVLMDNGGGDFDAWFNYDRVEVDDQGYSDKELWIDLIGGKQGTNKYFAYDKEFLTVSECLTFGVSALVNKDGTDRSNGDSDYDDLNANASVTLNGDGSVSLFEDNACSEPFEPSLDTKYLRANVNTSLTFESLPIGWFVYNNTDQADVIILPTEFFPNSDQDLLVDGGANQLISQSVNTTVPGRYVLWMTGGITGGDARSIQAQVEERAPTPSPPSRPPSIAFTSVSPLTVANNSSALFTVFGARLNSVSSATVNGVPVEIVSIEAGRIVFRLPALAAGTHDLIMFAQNEVHTFQSAVTVAAGLAIAPSNSQIFVIGKGKTVQGFSGDSAVLTARQKTVIAAAVSALGTARTITCVGSTSNRTVTPVDKTLARSRAVAACSYAKRLNSTLTTVIKTAPSSAVGPKARNVTIMLNN